MIHNSPVLDPGLNSLSQPIGKRPAGGRQKPTRPVVLGCQSFVSSQETEGVYGLHYLIMTPLSVCLSGSVSIQLLVFYKVLGLNAALHAIWTSALPTKLHHTPAHILPARTWLDTWPVDSRGADSCAYQHITQF